MQRTVKGDLSPLELDAWRGLLRTHARLVRELDHELVAAHGLPLTSYEVLIALAGAPGERLRMSEVADSLLLSQSGITRLVDRLERDGLVRREPCEEDGRGLYAALTPHGRAALRAARATHLAGVRRRFLDPLSDRELSSLAGAWRRVLDAG